MARKTERSETERQVADLLVTAKKSLHQSVAFLTRMDGTTQHLEVVESSVPFLFPEGATQVQATTFCQAILDNKLPAVIPNVRDFPHAMSLPAAKMPRIRSYVSAPVVLSDGSLYGTFCAAGLTSDKELTDRDEALMNVLAQAAAVILEPGVREREEREEIEGRLLPLMDADGPTIVLQPIVDLSNTARVGYEALSRFPMEWGKTPDVVFAEAHTAGLGDDLELMAIARACSYIEMVRGYVAVNISPATLLLPRTAELLRSFALDRILLELSEHDRVEDYDAVHAVLRPLRTAGLRLAIDDVGAGFSSLRHIVLTAPEVIKLDRTMIDGVHGDQVLRTLVHSLVEFAKASNAKVVAEGIETVEDAAVLRELGVDYGQGWYFGRPAPAADFFEPAEVAPVTAQPPAVPLPATRPQVSLPH